MIKVENIDIWGFEHAIRGMRNPKNSWDKSDSGCNFFGDEGDEFVLDLRYRIGPNDLKLMRTLYKAGTEHRKYLRQIFVSMDITAPLYWWKEFDTYKVGTVANSCSTMHKIASKEFTIDDFSNEHLLKVSELDKPSDYSPYVALMYIIAILNEYRDKYNETKDNGYWWQLIQLLPSSYNQKRTVTMNYENVMTIINQRTGHKLDEWNDLVKILRTLPYVEAIRSEGDD